MKKTLRRVLSLLTVAAILACGLVTTLGSFTASAAEVVTEEWIYDFKSGTGTETTIPAYLKEHPTVHGDLRKDLNSWLSGGLISDVPASCPAPSFDDGVLHYYSYYTNSVNTNSASPTGEKGSAENWCRGFALWDADVARAMGTARTFSDGKFDSGATRNTFIDSADDANLYVTYALDVNKQLTQNAGLVAIEDGMYAVTIKFKVVSMNSATTRLDIGAGAYNVTETNLTKGYDLTTDKSFQVDFATVWKPMDDYETVTVFIDGAKFKGAGSNFLKITVSNDSFTNDGTLNQIDFESIKVKRYYDPTNDETAVRFAAPKTAVCEGVDVAGAEPVIGSANTGVKLAYYTDNSTDKEFVKWVPYDVKGWAYRNMIQGAPYAAYNVTANNYDNAKKLLSTYAGATFTPGAGEFAMLPNLVAAVAAPTDTNVYTLDTAGMVANSAALETNAQSFISSDIKGTFKTGADGGLQFTGTHGDWFEPHKNYEYAELHRLGFYTLTDKGTAGNYYDRGLKLKNGYTYEFEMTFKVDENPTAAAKSVNIGIGTPIIADNYWTWCGANVIERWRTYGNTADKAIDDRFVNFKDGAADENGYVTVKTRFNGNNFNNGKFFCFLISGNSHTITIKSAKVTETFIGTVNVNGVTFETGAALLTDTVTVNGNETNGDYYADSAKNVPVTGFNSKVRTVYAGTTKVFDYTGANGDIITEATADGLKIDVIPDAGYKLAAGGLTATAGGIASKVIFKGDAADATGEGTGLCFKTQGVDASGITAVAAQFVAEDDLSYSLIAKSATLPTEDAGIRFRGRVTKAEDIQKVGFLLLPTALLNGELTVDNTKAVNVDAEYTGAYVYDESGEYKDFQVKLEKLYNAVNGFDLRSIEITCVMYIVKSDNSVVYSDSGVATFSDIAAQYN